MSDPFENVKGGRLTFKGGSLATRKSIDKKKHKKKHKINNNTNNYTTDDQTQPIESIIDDTNTTTDGIGIGGDVYTIDAAKKLKYDQLFPVEAKKFGYDPKSTSKSVEEALDDRVKKKADRYCK